MARRSEHGPTPYRDDLTAALARAEDAEREVDRLEEELDIVREEVDRLRAAGVEPQHWEVMIPPNTALQDQQKEITKLRRGLERTRQKLDKWRRRRPVGMRVNLALMVIAALLGAWLQFLFRH